MSIRRNLRRYHVWLGWIVALPILFWVVSGLIMILKPLDEVRGRHLLHPPAPVTLRAPPVTPGIEELPLATLAIEQRAGGPRWVAKVEGGPSRLADPATGQWLPRLSAADAVREVMARYKGSSKVASVTRTDPAKPPLDLREPVETWQVAMADGTHFYVDRSTGQILATRTKFWRLYDWMWGLHIMDLTTRENPHNMWTATLGIASLVMAFLALFLLPMTIKRKRKKDA